MFIRGLDKRYNLGLMKAVSRGGNGLCWRQAVSEVQYSMSMLWPGGRQANMPAMPAYYIRSRCMDL